METKLSPFLKERSLQPFELEVGRHIAWDDTNNRAKGVKDVFFQVAQFMELQFSGLNK